MVTVALGVRAEKKEKRGILHEHGHAAPLPLAQYHSVPLEAAPLPAAHHLHAEIPSAQLFAAAPAYAAPAFAAPAYAAPAYAAPAYAAQPHFAAANYAVQTAPAQVNTIIKEIAVPHERIIPIDNVIPGKKKMLSSST